MKKMMKNLLAISLIIMMITAGSSIAVAQSIHICKTKNNNNMELEYKAHEIKDANRIDYDKIISNGDNQLEYWKGGRFKTIRSKQELTDYKSLLLKLEEWYNAQPDVEFASLIDTTMTLKFNDGSYNLIFLDLPDFSVDESQKNQFFSIADSRFEPSLEKSHDCLSGKGDAVILNPIQWQCGNYPCSFIKTYLTIAGYHVDYRENDEVNITFLKNGGLSADVIFYRGHGGPVDLNNDSIGDFVVVLSGEEWISENDETYNKYSKSGDLHPNNDLPPRVMRGNPPGTNKYYVCYTPYFISHYYNNPLFPKNSLQGSLVFMATCDSMMDDSMAKAFVDDAGAAAYIGWNREVQGYTCDFFSERAFGLLCNRGYNVKKTCNRINNTLIFMEDDCYLWILRMNDLWVRLKYYGNGNFSIADHGSVQDNHILSSIAKLKQNPRTPKNHIIKIFTDVFSTSHLTSLNFILKLIFLKYPKHNLI